VSKKINTTSIGLFIVTGVALGVIGLLLFSSSKLFTKTKECIVYFDESLNGLKEGAPVKYRGVTIGSVTRVMVRYNQASNDYAMPVIIELEERLLQERMGEPTEIFTGPALEERIQGGLRASLLTESMVTGVLYIGLHPNTNAPPPVYHQLKKRYTELPTEPTQINQLMKNLASLDISGLVENLNLLVVKLDTTVGGLNLEGISAGVTNLLTSVDRLVSSPEITNDLAAVRTTLEQYRVLGEKLNSRIDPVADSLTNSLMEANRALVQIRGTAEGLRTLLAPDSPLRNELDQALQQLSNAGQSMSSLLEYLKLNPNALITGRKIQEEQP